MLRAVVLGLMMLVPPGVSAQETVPTGGRNAHQPEPFLRTGDAVALCLRREAPWVDFCNGLVQGYAEAAILRGAACIPFGTARRDLVEVFTGPDVVVSTGYVDNLAALETAVEMFARHYPCP